MSENVWYDIRGAIDLKDECFGGKRPTNYATKQLSALMQLIVLIGKIIVNTLPCIPKYPKCPKVHYQVPKTLENARRTASHTRFHLVHHGEVLETCSESSLWRRFQYGENFFCIYFTFEVMIRFMSFKNKRNCIKDNWFNFDTCLVSLMTIETCADFYLQMKEWWISFAIPILYQLVMTQASRLIVGCNLEKYVIVSALWQCAVQRVS